MGLACCDNEVQEKVLPHTLSERKFIKYADYEAVLEMNYFIKEGDKEKIHEMSPEEFQRYKQESKEAKRLEKLAKKEARAKRKAEYDANIARKEKIMKAIPKYPNKEKN